MLQQYHRTPFYITGVNGGFTEVTGLIRVDHEHLVLEFQSADAIIGIVKSDLKTKKVPFTAIRRLDFKKGWFSTKLILQTNSMSDLDGIPGANSGSVTFNIKRAHRQEAVELNSYFQLEFSEHRIRQLDQHTETI